MSKQYSLPSRKLQRALAAVLPALLVSFSAFTFAQDPDAAAAAPEPDAPAVTPADDASAIAPAAASVFTAEQQTAGQNAYLINCSTGCHQPDLAGIGPIAPLRGPRFLSSWGSQPVSELLAAMKNAMPPTAPGSLPDDTYLNIIAYILSSNGGLAGTNALTSDTNLLISELTVPGGPTTPGGPPTPPEAEGPTGVTVVGTVPDYVPVTDAMLNNPAPEDWLMLRGNHQAHSYSALAEINTENVKGLQLAWVWTLGEDATNQLSPLVHNGILYLWNPGNKIQALTADTGNLIWEHSLGGRLGVMRGMTIYEDKLISNTPDGHIVALNAANGELIWSTLIAEGFSNSSGPIIGNGKVFTGMTTCTQFREQKCFVSAYDANDGRKYTPLHAIPQARASFEIRNSPLSENAAIGFEYGYNIQAPGTLVIWEAQYGDFINGAQTMLDEFVLSARAKWGQEPSLVLLLPHGYEGQGPDHASGRPERFLQLAADINMRVANCTTAAQFFHLLRRQAALLENDPLPLIVMTPKSLLRHPKVASRPIDLAEGRWMQVIDDEERRKDAAAVRRLLLCSGKVAVDLLTHAKREATPDVAVCRVEQLYPLPVRDILGVIEGYPKLEEVIWVQEEPENMGAWDFVRPSLEGLAGGRRFGVIARPRSSSPAEGSAARHAQNQEQLVTRALTASRESQKSQARSQK